MGAVDVTSNGALAAFAALGRGFAKPKARLERIVSRPCTAPSPPPPWPPFGSLLRFLSLSLSPPVPRRTTPRNPRPLLAHSVRRARIPVRWATCYTASIPPAPPTSTCRVSKSASRATPPPPPGRSTSFPRISRSHAARRTHIDLSTFSTNTFGNKDDATQTRARAHLAGGRRRRQAKRRTMKWADYP